MASVSELMIKISADLKEFEKKMGKMSKDIQKVGKQFTETGKTLTKGLTVPIMGAVAASVKFASDLEESQNKVNVAFKQSAGVIDRWSDTTLKSFGIAKGTAMDMAATFGDMGTAMGQLPSTAAEMSKSLAGLAGDLASFKNIGIDQASTALKGIYTGEGEALKTLGIIMLDSTLIAYAQAKGYEKSYKEMSQAEKVAIRYAYVMETTKNAQGDFARTSGGVANQLRIVQEGLKQAAASLGTQLLPKVAEGLKYINGLIERFENLDDKTKSNIISFGLMAAAIGPTMMVLGKMTSTVGLVTARFTQFSQAAALGKASLSTLIGPQGIAVLVIAALAGIAFALQAWSRDAKEASKATNELLGAAKAAKDAYASQVDEIENNAVAAKKLTDEINLLNAVENKSADQKQKMAGMVAQLNDLMPDLNLYINEQTGLLDRNIDSVYAFIDAKKEQLKLQADEERIVEIYKEQGQQQRELAKEQDRLAKASDKSIKKILSSVTPWGAWKTSMEYREAVKNVENLTQLGVDLENELKSLWGTHDQYTYEIGQNNREMGKSTEEFAAAMTQNFIAASQAVEKSADRTGSAYAGLLDEFADYREAMEEAKKTHIDNMGDLDDYGIEKTKLTAAKIKKNLEKQLEDLQNWRKSMQELSSRVPQEIMQELYELGPSFAPVIAELVNYTDKELAAWVKPWQDRAAEAEQAAKAELGSFPAWMAAEARKAGFAWANGLDSTLAAIKAAARRATNAASIGPVTYSSTSLGKLSTTVGMAQYATGTDYVPYTGPAIVHKGEKIITASENRTGRTRGDLNLTVNGVMNESAVARTVVHQLRMAGAI